MTFSYLPDGTQTVTLVEALRLASERNLTLKQMQRSATRAQAQLKQARSESVGKCGESPHGW
ncbi:MAG: hypothetical protein JXR76_19790 [Deltaproteobacteria bacterium]|nr:hypothetical protein [Deltaproteobacteria bacterium]